MDAVRYVVNVEAAVVRDGRYLTIVRADGMANAPGILAFPGGKLEAAGQSADALEETARRELREEAGVEMAGECVYVESHTFVADDGTLVLDVVMLGRYASGEAHPAAPDEVASVAWLTPAELRAHPGVMPWTLASLVNVERARAERGW
jgi:8-oxo-dGTP diphosphatase